jgi:hypothetical protein
LIIHCTEGILTSSMSIISQAWFLRSSHLDVCLHVSFQWLQFATLRELESCELHCCSFSEDVPGKKPIIVCTMVLHRFPEAPHLYNLIQWVREFANKTKNMCNSNGYAWLYQIECTILTCKLHSWYSPPSVLSINKSPLIAHLAQDLSSFNFIDLLSLAALYVRDSVDEMEDVEQLFVPSTSRNNVLKLNWITNSYRTFNHILQGPSRT